MRNLSLYFNYFKDFIIQSRYNDILIILLFKDFIRQIDNTNIQFKVVKNKKMNLQRNSQCLG